MTRTRKLVAFGFGIVLTLISILIIAGASIENVAALAILAFSGAVVVAAMWVTVRLYWRNESGWHKLRDRGLRNQQLFRQREQMPDQDTNHN